MPEVTTALRKILSELESGELNLSDVTETTLCGLSLTNRERAIILSGQLSLIRSVAAGQACIDEVRLELTPESREKLTG